MQSEKVAEFIKNVSIDKVYSSSLLRAKETAEIILQQHQGVNLALNDGFKEIIHGAWEGKSETENRARISRRIAALARNTRTI